MTQRKHPAATKTRHWWETLGGMAAAILAVAALVGGVYKLVLPHASVSIDVKSGSWTALGPDPDTSRARSGIDAQGKGFDVDPKIAGPRYRYGFDLEIRNSGTRPISMASKERRQVFVYTSEQRRPKEEPPTIELLGIGPTADVMIESKRNNEMQIGIRRLPVLASATLHVELLSPIHDLGGVSFVSDDSLFTGMRRWHDYQEEVKANNH